MASRLEQKYRILTAMDVRLRRPSAYVNWIRSNYELKRGVATIRAKPTKLTVDPTNVCQLRCPLCPTGQRAQDRDKGHAEFELLKRVLDEVGDSVFFIDFFNWGEPLLNPRTEDLIRLASAKKIVSSMSTNLSLPLTDERLERLITSGLNELIVAADGISPETYGTYRRQGKIELVFDNMRRIIALKRRLKRTTPVITWQFLVFSFNEHEMDRARELAVELGVDRLEFRTPFLQTDRFPVPEQDRQSISGWRASNPLFQIKTAGPEPGAKPRSRCGWHYMSSALNWDGTITPCCTTFQKGDDFGTVGHQGEKASYMEVVNNSTFQAVRNRFAGRRGPVQAICENCPTPMIMDYNEFLNRQVILVTLVALINLVKRFFLIRRAGRSTLPASVPSAEMSDHVSV
jgi:MoaA/NifB/PqqE/SkfB family radical SAM enzyme